MSLLVSMLAVMNACSSDSSTGAEPSTTDGGALDGDAGTSLDGDVGDDGASNLDAPSDSNVDKDAGGDAADGGKPSSGSRVVYGYYHFHNNKHPEYLKEIQWDKLTHIAWSFLYLHKDGSFANPDNAWPSQAPIADAHGHGVKVHLTVAMSSKNDELRQFLLNGKGDGSWKKAIDGIVTAMQNGHADGIGIDFERPKTQEERAPFVAFLQELRGKLDSVGEKQAEIVIALAAPYRDMKKPIDLQGILGVVDYIFIMGYDFFGGWANKAGPTGLLRTTDDFTRKNGSGTWLSEASGIGDYTKELSTTQRKQLIWGVPYYGFKYKTKTGKIGSELSSSDRKIVRFRGDELAPDESKRVWDARTLSPWYATQENGQWLQVYYDDKESITEKYRVAYQQDLGGVGMWSLGEELGYAGYWDALAAFKAMKAPLGYRTNPIKVTTLPFSDTKNTFDGAWFFNYYKGGSCDGDRPEYGPEWVYEITLKAAGTLTATVTAKDSFADPDVHLLKGPEQTDCLAQGDKSVSSTLQPGTYLVTVDSHVDALGVDHYGPFDLHLTFAVK